MNEDERFNAAWAAYHGEFGEYFPTLYARQAGWDIQRAIDAMESAVATGKQLEESDFFGAAADPGQAEPPSLA